MRTLIVILGVSLLLPIPTRAQTDHAEGLIGLIVDASRAEAMAWADDDAPRPVAIDAGSFLKGPFEAMSREDVRRAAGQQIEERRVDDILDCSQRPCRVRGGVIHVTLLEVNQAKSEVRVLVESRIPTPDYDVASYCPRRVEFSFAETEAGLELIDTKVMGTC